MKRLMWMGAAGMAALLAGCNDDRAPATRDFTGTVGAVVATPAPAAELREPLAVEAVMARTSETAEPVPVNF